ncbi:hypothetical protein VE04_08904, partial [Pseudogymnoascus sp. 24MN13]
MSEVEFTASPLADSFQHCARSFKELYLALFAYGPISLSKFNDEYGRFGVWGGDSGADRTGRGSLDDVLRNDPRTTSIIAELLENLNDDLNSCIALVEASADPRETQSHDGQDWLSDEESSVSSGSDAGETDSRVLSKTQRILHLLAIIVDHIQSLFQVSKLLRRPTISDRYVRSASKKTATETKSPSYPWDLAHIIEKRQFWINREKWDVPAENNKPEDTQHQMRNYICERLATANVKRREQLDFWQTHPAQPSAIKLPNEQIDPKPIATPDIIPPAKLPKKVVPRPEIATSSHGTKQSFSTVAKSDLNDCATFSGRPRTEYVSSTKGGKYVFQVPPVPIVMDESPTLKCPYCCTTLVAKSMLHRELWKKHVFRDLRPYVCTFEQCENPEKLYLTRHDWMYHETQMHRRQWICASCSQQKFSSRSNMKRHLLAKHSGQFPESQLMIIVDICERPMDDHEDADCPICLATLSLSALRVHLATHLEELALFVLPCHMEDRSQDVGSDKAEGATGRRLASNASSSEDGLPPLDFEKSLPDASHSQDPLSITASVLALATAAIRSTKSLDETVKCLKDRTATLRRLRHELNDLMDILESLTQVIDGETSVIKLLQGPINRCTQVCSEFEQLMKVFNVKSKTGFRDWTKMQFMGGNINEFIDTIAGYKSTITVGLGTITMHTSRVSYQVLQEYNEMIQDTVYNLEFHLQQIDAKIERYTSKNTNTSETRINLNDDRAVTKQCLLICEVAKAGIESLTNRESTLLQEAPQNATKDDMQNFKAQLPTRQALDGNRDSLTKIIGRLQERLESLLNEDPENDNEILQLQNNINISKQCLDVCEVASKGGNRDGLADTIGRLQERLESLLNEDPKKDNERLRLQDDINISKHCLDVCKVASEASYQKIYRIKEVIADSDSDSVVVTQNHQDSGLRSKSFQVGGNMSETVLQDV